MFYKLKKLVITQYSDAEESSAFLKANPRALFRFPLIRVSVLDSGSSGPDSSPGQGHCIVSLGKPLAFGSSILPRSGWGSWE